MLRRAGTSHAVYEVLRIVDTIGESTHTTANNAATVRGVIEGIEVMVLSMSRGSCGVADIKPLVGPGHDSAQMKRLSVKK